MYRYYATLNRVVDADTIDLDIDVGFKVFMTHRIRLMDIDAPERFTKEGKRLTQEVKLLFREYGNKVVLETRKSDSFGRYLGWIFWDGEQIVDDTCLNDLLLEDPSVKVWKKR